MGSPFSESRVQETVVYSKGALQGLLDFRISQVAFPTNNARRRRPINKTKEILEDSVFKHVSYVNTWAVSPS